MTEALGFLPSFCKHGAHAFELFRLWPGLLLNGVLLFVVPGILVTVGPYFHATRNKTSGFIACCEKRWPSPSDRIKL